MHWEVYDVSFVLLFYFIYFFLIYFLFLPRFGFTRSSRGEKVFDFFLFDSVAALCYLPGTRLTHYHRNDDFYQKKEKETVRR